MRFRIIIPLLFLLFSFEKSFAQNNQSIIRPNNFEAIDSVWSGNHVGFSIIENKTHVFIGYYDANRQLVIASRPKNQKSHWMYQKLDTWLGWDSHNHIAMGFSPNGELHVAANMHVDPLNYFKSASNSDVRTLKRQEIMVSKDKETKVTYPIFLNNNNGDLIFKFREGTSGRGNEIYYSYNAQSNWEPLFESVLVNGEGKRNAYFHGPILGKDGFFHLVWVWRDSPNAQTNHDLSYAKSKNLKDWFKADGTPYKLPIIFNTGEIIDPVPSLGGMINNNTIIGFDNNNNVLVAYHKYDKQGNTQIYLARYLNNKWQSKQISNWSNYRWDFKGNGTINFEIKIDKIIAIGDNKLKLIINKQNQDLEFLIDDTSLSTVSENKVNSLIDNNKKHFSLSDGRSLYSIESNNYVLLWASFAPHRDLPLTYIPSPSELIMFEKTQ